MVAYAQLSEQAKDLDRQTVRSICGPREQVQGNWNQAKGKAKQMWSDLTDDELDTIAGKRDELIGRLQTKYGVNKE